MEDTRRSVPVTIEERIRKSQARGPRNFHRHLACSRKIKVYAVNRNVQYEAVAMIIPPAVSTTPSHQGHDRLSTSDEPSTSADHGYRFCIFDVSQSHPLTQDAIPGFDLGKTLKLGALEALQHRRTRR